MENYVEDENQEYNDEDYVDENNEVETKELQAEQSDKSVFISGLPYTATENEIKELFKDCGRIKKINLPKYQDTGRNLGYGHIYFQKNKSIKKALEKSEKVFLGSRYVKVEETKGQSEDKSNIFI